MTWKLHPAWIYATTLARSQSVVFKAARFGLVGLLSAGIFSTVTALMAGWGGFDPELSSATGYVVSIPLNFVGNRNFSFLSHNKMFGDLLRYAILHLVNILLTTITMGTAVNALHLNYGVGIAAAVALIPVVNFIAMNWWVFRSGGRQPAAPQMPPNSPS